jgi:hypothetical protein
MKTKEKCPICGSKNLKSRDGMKRTGTPEVAKKTKARMSYVVYFYTEYTCECGHIWQIKK